MKKIPLGIDDFDKLIRENYYFADKSLIIKSIFKEESAQVILVPRPRRFWKSLNMSMMNFFSTLKMQKKTESYLMA